MCVEPGGVATPPVLEIDKLHSVTELGPGNFILGLTTDLY